MVMRGRPKRVGSGTGAVRTISRGSRGGMWRKTGNPVLETHQSDAGGASTAVYKGDRSHGGLWWESEGSIVPFEDQGQHNPVRGKGPCFVHATEEWRIRGLQRCQQARKASGHSRGSCTARPSRNQPAASMPCTTRSIGRTSSVTPTTLSALQGAGDSGLEEGACPAVKNIGKPCAVRRPLKVPTRRESQLPTLPSNAT